MAVAVSVLQQSLPLTPLQAGCHFLASEVCDGSNITSLHISVWEQQVFEKCFLPGCN